MALETFLAIFFGILTIAYACVALHPSTGWRRAYRTAVLAAIYGTAVVFAVHDLGRLW